MRTNQSKTAVAAAALVAVGVARAIDWREVRLRVSVARGVLQGKCTAYRLKIGGGVVEPRYPKKGLMVAGCFITGPVDGALTVNAPHDPRTCPACRAMMS